MKRLFYWLYHFLLFVSGFVFIFYTFGYKDLTIPIAVIGVICSGITGIWSMYNIRRIELEEES